MSEHAGLAAQRVQGDVNALQVKPLGQGLYKATLTMTRAMREKLSRAKDLLGYRRSEPDEAEILEMGLDLLIARLEKRKFGAADRPRAVRRSENSSHVSPAVRRHVFERDGSRCTFESEDGVRCPETRGLECDHLEPVARGGTSEPSNLRLRCRAHNQLEAERAFGKEFMQHKRELARAAAARRKADKEAREKVEEAARETARKAAEDAEVVTWLATFGYTAEQAAPVMAKVRPGIFAETRRLTCLALLRENDRLAATGT